MGNSIYMVTLTKEDSEMSEEFGPFLVESISDAIDSTVEAMHSKTDTMTLGVYAISVERNGETVATGTAELGHIIH